MKLLQRNSISRDLTIILGQGLIIGLYLIATTVVISKDGVFYIERAQKIKDAPAEVLAQRPSGYELMILSSHQIYHAITGENTAQSWIFAAQGVTLLCKLLAIVGFYLAGCLLIGRSRSFWGCVILLVLPESAHMGSDVLREWPNLAFMSFSLFFLLYGFKKNRPWAFGLIGLLGAMSFYIRPESFLLILIPCILLVGCVIKSTQYCSRPKAALGLTLLLVGFAGPFLTYAGCSGKLKTNYLKGYQDKASIAFKDLFVEPSDVSADEESGTAARKSWPTFLYELYKDTGESLMWFFLPFWGIGLYHRMRHKADTIERFWVSAFILTTLGLLLFRYWYAQPVISRRWILPIICITVFYIPIGIQQVVHWGTAKNSPSEDRVKMLYQILITIGILICTPKLIKPLGFDKRGYRQVASWLEKNTGPSEVIYSFDKRIPFYAERKNISYKDPRKAKKFSEQTEGWDDFNDGALSDVLWQDINSGACLIRLINGTLIFNRSRVPVRSSWQIEGVVDFNGDSKMDVLWRNTSGAYLIRLMDGDDMLSEAKVPAGRPWQVEELGDFNGDGMSDILWHDTDTDAYLIRLMNGTSMISQDIVPAGRLWQVEQLGDFNGDGMSDILWHNIDTDAYLIRLMNGTNMISQCRVLCIDHLIILSTTGQTGMLEWEGLELKRSFFMKSGKKELLIFGCEP